MNDHVTDPRLRRSNLAQISGGRPVLLLAPHPDDESLACGALLAEAFATTGAHVVCMTDGSASHKGSASYPPERIAKLRAAELKAAIACLGGSADHLTRLNLRDAAMPPPEARQAVVEQLVALAGAIGAGTLIAPAPTDPHCDHVACAEIAVRVAADAGLRLFSYPVWSRWWRPRFRDELDYRVEHRLPVDRHRAAKRRAIHCHASQRGKVIHDAGQAFVMDPAFEALFETGDEIFFEMPQP